jgi:hypothetical protein
MNWKLIGVGVGLAVALLFGFAVAGTPQDLINVLLIALPHSVVITLINALLFVAFASQGGASPVGAIIGGLVGGVIGAIESIIVWRLSPTMPVLVAGGIAAVAYLLALVRTFARPIWDRVSAVIIRVLDFQIGLPTPKVLTEDPHELYYRPYPRKLQFNVPALILGPVWYLLAGLWVHASILLSLLFLTGGALAPIVWLYCGLKANEDLLEFRIARHNVY